MNCVVTAGPTYEKLDEVRRLTNFSTGRLGTELADFLAGRGHRVALLLGEQATHPAASRAAHVERFSTAQDLRDRLLMHAGTRVNAVFHAAAVGDFTFGKTFTRSPDGALVEERSGKLSSRQGTFLAELVPTPKLIADLRGWYAKAVLVGWKYEVEGTHMDVVRLGEAQLAGCRTNACVLNGPAYGNGFGLVTSPGVHQHLADSAELFAALEKLLQA